MKKRPDTHSENSTDREFDEEHSDENNSRGSDSSNNSIPCICCCDGSLKSPDETKEDKERGFGATCSIIVDGLDCADCAVTVESAVSEIAGLRNPRMNIITSRLMFEYDDRVSPDAVADVKKVVRKIGYQVRDIEGQERVTIKVPEMDCSDEIRMIRNHLKSVDGIVEIKFYPLNREIKFVLDTDLIKVGEIVEKIKELGMTPETPDIEKDQEGISKARLFLVTTIISGIFILIGILLFKVFHLKNFAIPVFLAAIVIGGYFIAKRAVYSARHKNIDMNVLMSIAVIGAVLLGEWIEGSIIVFLFSLAQMLEHYSLERSRNAVRELMDLAPDKAIVRRDGQLVTVSPAGVNVGEIIIVKPGMKIPLDGEVAEGASSVNQAPITGESMPVVKRAGDPVYAGTINGKGAIEIRVTHGSRDTTLARIVNMVQEAQARRAPAQNFVDRFSTYYTPIVIGIAVLIATIPPIFFSQPFHIWIYRSLVLLVISCPCALVISTPVSVVSGLTRAARDGVLIKGGIYLENFANTRVLALDKTGTLTRGKPEVTRIFPINKQSEEEILAIAAGIENLSEHPIANAIVEKAKQSEVSIPDMVNFNSVTGLGAAAQLNDHRYFVGSHRFFEEKRICSEEAHERVLRLESKGNTTVMVGDEREPMGIIVIRDELRENAKKFIKEAKKQGIDKIVMLTGDNEETARAVAEELGIDYRAELLPEDKVSVVEELIEKEGETAMVGDGINDAPALAAANVGIAMGAAGTDTALEVADIALMADDLEKIPFSLRLSKGVMNTIRQNIVISIGLKLIFLILAVLGIATLWMAIFADMGASLLVIFNGLRLLKFR